MMKVMHKNGTKEMEKLAGQTVVVKYGGSALLNDDLRQGLVDETIELTRAGVKVIVVHGGGPKINETLAKMGIATVKVQGLRVTDPETMQVVNDVLSSVNRDIVSSFEAKGAKALSIYPGQNNVFYSKKMIIKDEKGEVIDIGWVGEIQWVDTFAISRALESGYVPVVAPIGMDAEGNYYNINADHAALAVAAQVHAANLLFLTDVPGVLGDVKDPSTRFPSLTPTDIAQHVQSGVITGGMLPKVNSCVSGLEKGIQKISIVDGKQAKALMKGILNPGEVGTVICGAMK
jgi:acetylglutamate kinase